ncbi:hypothetical protein D3C77_665750 [compost metagenome]
MFAQRIQLDVGDDDHLVTVRGKQRAVDDLIDALFVTMTQVLHGLGRAHRCVLQSFAVGIFTQVNEDFAVILGQ